MNKNIKESVISSPSRLHLGFYGLDDDYGYTFGSMGVAIDEYQTKLLITSSKKFSTNCLHPGLVNTESVSYTHLTLPTKRIV